ncbi:MAG TPA: Fur family transcriptional regulator [Pseudonocardiaceae bacterium]|nr:Fur family transcriptional regulator [Pseudonocardiaceae bacterium]
MTAGRHGERRYQTRQRRAVLRALTTVSGFISAQDLYAHLRHAGEPVGLGTVYRTLHGLADAGDIDTTRTTTGEQLFQYCAQPGCTRFLVCRQCGRRVALDARPVEQWATATATRHGFTDIDLVVEITGRCANCA